MLERDKERFRDAMKRINISPLGCGALAGTTFPIDRNYSAEPLGFDSIYENSLDGVSDRDFILEFLSGSDDADDAPFAFIRRNHSMVLAGIQIH